MTYNKELFAGNIRAHRARLRMTRDDLSTATGLSASTIKTYECAENIPSIESAMKLADAFGVSLESLVSNSWDRPESG